MASAKQAVSVELNASPLEEISPGLTFQWLFDKRAIGLYAQHASRQLVDAWANKIMELAETWDVNRPYFALNDFSAKDCVVTPYNQQKNRELWGMYPHLKSVSATVVQQNLTMVLTRIFIRTLPNNKNVHLCFSRNDGLLWLKNKVDEHEKTFASASK